MPVRGSILRWVFDSSFLPGHARKYFDMSCKKVVRALAQPPLQLYSVGPRRPMLAFGTLVIIITIGYIVVITSLTRTVFNEFSANRYNERLNERFNESLTWI